MGFAKKSRREAQQQQLQAMQMQRHAYDDAQRRFSEYQNSFNTRNAPVIGLQTSAQNWLNRYGRGEDIASLNPTLARNAQMSANQVGQTMRFASKLGDRRVGDADYQAKLNSLSTREISKGLAMLNEEGLLSELQSQRGILMDTSNFLNADARAGLGLSSELFNMTNSIFNNATTRRQMEIQRSNMMMQNFMGFLSTGIQAGLGIASLGASSAVSAGVSGNIGGAMAGSH